MCILHYCRPSPAPDGVGSGVTDTVPVSSQCDSVPTLPGPVTRGDSVPTLPGLVTRDEVSRDDVLPLKTVHLYLPVLRSCRTYYSSGGNKKMDTKYNAQQNKC